METAGRSLLRRSASLLLLLAVVSIIAFMLPHLGHQAAETRLGGPSASADEIIQLRADYALDQPLPIQYIKWLARLVQGDFGRSWLTNLPVLDELLRRAPASIELLLYGIVAGGLIAVPVGIAAGLARGTAQDGVMRGAALLADAVPAFFLALLLLLVFFHWLDLAPPPTGRISLMLTPPPPITGSLFIDAVLIQDATAARSALGHLVLPVLCIALSVAAPMMLRVRAIALGLLDAPHIRHARAQGLPGEMVTAIATRGALAPAVPVVGRELAALLGTVAVVEYVFGWGGMAQFGLDALARGDLAVGQGLLVLATLFAAIVLFLAGLLRRALEPRSVAP